MAAVSINNTTITAGHSDRHIAIGKLADAMKSLAEALQEPDGVQYGIYIGHVDQTSGTNASKSDEETI
jgi:hypothetical protein